jgi:hypothetical protein
MAGNDRITMSNLDVGKINTELMGEHWIGWKGCMVSRKANGFYILSMMRYEVQKKCKTNVNKERLFARCHD